MSAFKFLISETKQKNRALLDNQKQQKHTKRLSEAEMWFFQLSNVASETNEKIALLRHELVAIRDKWKYYALIHREKYKKVKTVQENSKELKDGTKRPDK